MIALGVLPLVLTVLLGVVGPRAAQWVSGRTATLLLTVGALACSLSVGLVLSAIGCLAVAQWAPLANAGRWSSGAVAARDPLPYWVDLSCGLLALGLIAATAVRLVVSLRRLKSSATLCRRLGREHAGELVVLHDERPEAYALAGLPGRVVVTRAMLRALSGAERRALLAHEGSHVANYHFVYVNLVQLAAAANPLLLPLIASVRLAVERWADEDAARAVADRDLVATTLARAGLARSGRLVPRGALGAAISDVHLRMNSLVAPRHSTARTTVWVTAIVVGTVCCVASSGTLGLQLHNLIEWAQTTGARPRP